MTERRDAGKDARFEDAAFADRPLRLFAESTEDLQVISALVQDAVGVTEDIAWLRGRGRLVILINRFRWEDAEAARRQKRGFERVRAALVFDRVEAVQASGLSPEDRDTVFSILQVVFEPNDAPSGHVLIALAGDGALRLSVECLEARLIDLTRPWQAAAGSAPDHDLGD